MSSFLAHDCRRFSISGPNVTAQYFGDPGPRRAGKAPDCEESQLEEQLASLRRELGLDIVVSERALRAAAAEMESLLADRDRLKPRRYRPGEVFQCRN